MGERRKARIMAFQILYSWEINPSPLPELIEAVREMGKEEDLKEESLLWVRILTAGTIENIDTIDRDIEKHLEHWEMKRVSRIDLALLRISVYQLLFMEDVPSTVAINEAVEIAKKYGTQGSYRFINGVLDGIIKEIN